MKALVIGGTGPTGPHIVSGLLDRGFEVTIMHRGVHEPNDLPPVRHLHADPHFLETLTSAVGDETFDVVLSTYGRVAVTAEVFDGRCAQLVTVGGAPIYRGFYYPERVKPYGMAVLAREDSPLAEPGEGPESVFAAKMVAAERSLFERAARGAYSASTVRYPQIYGARNMVPWEWAVIKRVRDGRHAMILPDNGLWILSRCAARNAAEVLLKIVDHPGEANGEAYNCADDDQFTSRQWAESVAEILGADLEFVGIPRELAPSALSDMVPAMGSTHVLVDASKAAIQLGYRQVVTAHDALVETVRWLETHPVLPEDYPAYNVPFDYALEDRLIEAYRKACAKVRAEVPDAAPPRRHPMPHPRRPSTVTDEHGR